jgi:DNA polymerase-3 subunit delta'
MSWQRIRGHEALVRSFTHVIRRGRLAHAYLFTGPPGIGKRLFARELAKVLLCEHPDAGKKEVLEGCDQCPACIQIDANTHPDFSYVERPEDKNEFPVELMREVREWFSLKSARGKGKVVVLNDAEDFNEESANAFLKTLEEPPPGSVLVLITCNLDRQLPTIISRCQVIRFAPLPLPQVEEMLRALKNEDGQPAVPSAMVPRLVRLSGGSPGIALALADPALWEFRRLLLAGLTRPPVKSVELAKAWMEFAEGAGKEGPAQRKRSRLVLQLLIDFLSDVLALQAGQPPRRTEEEDRPLLQAMVGLTSTERTVELLERCMETDRQIARYVPLVLCLEALLDALAQALQVR